MRVCKIIIMAMLLVVSLDADAQGKQCGQRLSKEQFMAELEKFLTTEAELTPQECSRLFPIMREMYSRQRAYFDKMKKQNMRKPQSEEECRQAVKLRDKMDIDIKKMQQTYHNKMLNVISPCKVRRVIFAEDKFHRQMLKDWSRNGRKR